MVNFIKPLVLLSLLLFLPIFTTMADPPFSSDQILADFKANSKKAYVSIELSSAERYTSEERNYDLYPYYCSQVIATWEGTYGHLIQEFWGVNYIKIGGVWILDTVFEQEKDRRMIKEPTKPLPEAPEKPTIEAVKRLFDDYKPVFGNYDKVGLVSIDLRDSTTRRGGLDYEYYVYNYTGTYQYYVQPPRNPFPMPKEIYEYNVQVEMGYNYIDKTWNHMIYGLSDKKRIK